MNPRNTNELLIEAAQCARDGDICGLETLQVDFVDGWIQDEESRAAQTRMIDTFISLVEAA